MFAMDPDYDTDCVFWADIEKDIIMKQCLNSKIIHLEHPRLA